MQIPPLKYQLCISLFQARMHVNVWFPVFVLARFLVFLHFPPFFLLLLSLRI